MDCFLITSPEGIDPYQIFNELSIEAKSDLSYNGYLAYLQQWQVIELINLKFIVFKNSECKL